MNEHGRSIITLFAAAVLFITAGASPAVGQEWRIFEVDRIEVGPFPELINRAIAETIAKIEEAAGDADRIANLDQQLEDLYERGRRSANWYVYGFAARGRPRGDEEGPLFEAMIVVPQRLHELRASLKRGTLLAGDLVRQGRSRKYGVTMFGMRGALQVMRQPAQWPDAEVVPRAWDQIDVEFTRLAGVVVEKTLREGDYRTGKIVSVTATLRNESGRRIDAARVCVRFFDGAGDEVLRTRFGPIDKLGIGAAVEIELKVAEAGRMSENLAEAASAGVAYLRTTPAIGARSGGGE